MKENSRELAKKLKELWPAFKEYILMHEKLHQLGYTIEVDKKKGKLNVYKKEEL